MPLSVLPLWINYFPIHQKVFLISLIFILVGFFSFQYKYFGKTWVFVSYSTALSLFVANTGAIFYKFYYVLPKDYFLGNYLGVEVHRVIPYEARKSLITKWFTKYLKNDIPEALECLVSAQKNALISAFDNGYYLGKNQVLNGIVEIDNRVAAFKVTECLSPDKPTGWLSSLLESVGIDLTNPTHQMLVYGLSGVVVGVGLCFIYTVWTTGTCVPDEGTNQLTGSQLVDPKLQKAMDLLERKVATVNQKVTDTSTQVGTTRAEVIKLINQYYDVTSSTDINEKTLLETKVLLEQILKAISDSGQF